MSKAQIAITDLFLAVILLMILIIAFFTIWNNYQLRYSEIAPRTEQELYTMQLANQLVTSPGVPDSWEANQIPQYGVDNFTIGLLHMDEVINNADPGGTGTSGHHNSCSVGSDCGASAPACCFVPDHDGYVCEVASHHSGICEVGILPDSSSNANDGYMKPDYPIDSAFLEQTDECKINRCISFDGSNDYVMITDSNSFSNMKNFTIEMWIYPTEDQ